MAAPKKGNFATRVKDMGEEVAAMRETVEGIVDLLEKHPALLELLDHPFVRDFRYWEAKIKRLEQTTQMLLQNQGNIEQQLRRAENLVRRAEVSRTRGA